MEHSQSKVTEGWISLLSTQGWLMTQAGGGAAHLCRPSSWPRTVQPGHMGGPGSHSLEEHGEQETNFCWIPTGLTAAYRVWAPSPGSVQTAVTSDQR